MHGRQAVERNRGGDFEVSRAYAHGDHWMQRLAGERHMVHEDDRAVADEIMRLMPPLSPPPDWKGAWKRDKGWRGINYKPREPRRLAPSGVSEGFDPEEYLRRPGVVFTGAFPTERSELIAQAEQHGWRALGGVTDKAVILVVGDKAGSKLAKAQARGIQIVDLETWLDACLEAAPF